MFPMDMAGQRDRLVAALGHIASHVDQVDRLVGFLRELGADHRKYAVRAEHYPGVGEALLATFPWLTVHYVVGLDPNRPGEPLRVVDQALGDGDWRLRHVLVCGSDQMVTQTVDELRRAGYHDAQLHHEGLGTHWYGPDRRLTVGARSPTSWTTWPRSLPTCGRRTSGSTTGRR